MAEFSQKLLAHPEAKNAPALDRIRIAKRRIQAILDRETVAHQKTLEQKISEQGPRPMRVDPHLIGLAIMDLLQLNRLATHTHQSTRGTSWYANPGTPAEAAVQRLDSLAPLYARVSGGGFSNLTGDALELVVYKCLEQVYAANPRYPFQGHFRLNEPKEGGRYKKTQPVYPHHSIITELIIKAIELHAFPVLVARRMHYTTIKNLLEPAGIIAHESYYQYYPADQAELAAKVKDKRSLGFTDVTASEQPHARTQTFFNTNLPDIVDRVEAKWNANKDALLAYALSEMNLAQLYTAIDSPAGGKWFEPDIGTPE